MAIYRPAYNVQLASDGKSRMIVGVTVSNVATDYHAMIPMLEQIKENFGRTPTKLLVDCGYPSVEGITRAEKSGTEVYAPVYGKARMEAKGKDPYERQQRDTDESFAFRKRMATAEAQALYQQRPSIAEYSNAELRNRGLTQFRVRGLKRVLSSTLLYALSFNFMRAMSLGIAK